MKFWANWCEHAAAAKQPKGEGWSEITFQAYMAAVHPNLYVYDVESYPNVFTCTFHRPSDGAIWRFEISHRRNDGVAMFQLLLAIRNSGGRMVGFNNVGYDYNLIHLLVERGGHVTAAELHQKTVSIIESTARFPPTVREGDRLVPQIDLFKIHHFDNKARMTSLKMLEFNMKSESIQDLPFPPGSRLTDQQIDTLISYNDKDVFETTDFLAETVPMLEFRDELSAKYGRDFTNHSDTKIGKDFFIMRLEEAGIKCFDYTDGRRQPRQTVRPSIDLNSVIFPWTNFNHPEFQRIVDHLRAQTITETKGVFKNLSCTVNGFQYDFGTGGIHGSVESQIVASDEYYQIVDLDVASYYPNLAIANGLFPAHLGREFCDIYLDVYNQRKGYAKGTAENAMLKLALNGVYGDSNNQYSPFFDPAYTMSITLNGQLLLCLLAEYLATVPGLSMVQINTDGLTVRCPRQHVNQLTFIASTWEQLTGLTLERADYSRMMIRDVNSYIAEYEGGDLKRKGAYCYGGDLAWHQNHGAQIVAIAAEAALVRGESIADVINRHANPFDFMLRTKVPRSSRLMLEAPGAEPLQLQNITRYFISTGGGALMKVMPPTPAQQRIFDEYYMVKLTCDDGEKIVEFDSDRYQKLIEEGWHTDNVRIPVAPERRIGINVGWAVTPCNHISEFDWLRLNRAWYIAEARKLVDPLC